MQCYDIVRGRRRRYFCYHCGRITVDCDSNVNLVRSPSERFECALETSDCNNLVDLGQLVRSSHRLEVRIKDLGAHHVKVKS